MSDIFYAVNQLNFEQKVQLMKDAKEICYAWRSDVLKSVQRQPYESTFENMIAKVDKDTFIFFIVREFEFKPEDGPSLEIGYRTMGRGYDYFLWINADIKYLDTFVKKYQLKKM